MQNVCVVIRYCDIVWHVSTWDLSPLCAILTIRHRGDAGDDGGSEYYYHTLLLLLFHTRWIWKIRDMVNIVIIVLQDTHQSLSAAQDNVQHLISKLIYSERFNSLHQDACRQNGRRDFIGIPLLKPRWKLNYFPLTATFATIIVG